MTILHGFPHVDCVNRIEELVVPTGDSILVYH